LFHFLLVLSLPQEHAEMGATRHLDASSEIFTVLRNKYVFNFGGYAHKYDFCGGYQYIKYYIDSIDIIL